MTKWVKVILASIGVASSIYAGIDKYIVGPRRRGRAQRRLQKRKTIAIAALRPGELAKITGIAAARDALLTSPIGRQPCIAFRTSIDFKPTNSGGEVWLPAARREACGIFSITDDSGTAAVEGPFGLELLDPDDGAWANLPPTAYAFLEEQGGPDALSSIGDHPIRFQEALLKPGDRISVLGRATSEPDQIRGSSDEPVVIVDAEEL